ncbi:MAG: amidohydrolase [Clostridia bacterium]|nr:amidohydrolase [Clostridia bacterium]
MFKVFDVHTHTYPEKIAEKACENLGQFYNFEVLGKGTYADLESQAEANHVGGYLLFSVATNAHQVPKVNDSIAALAEYSRSRGFKTVGYAGMHQDYPDFEGEIERAVSLGLRGVKIHPDIQGVDIDDPRLLPLYEILEARGMPIYLHMGDNRPEYQFSSADKLVRVLEMFPRLIVGAAHLGGYKSWDVNVPLLAGRENVWYDTSSALWAMSAEDAERIIHTLGVENIMFGTDYPVVNTKEELERFFRILLTDDEREAILWNNAMRFFGMEDA